MAVVAVCCFFLSVLCFSSVLEPCVAPYCRLLWVRCDIVTLIPLLYRVLFIHLINKSFTSFIGKKKLALLAMK